MPTWRNNLDGGRGHRHSDDDLRNDYQGLSAAFTETPVGSAIIEEWGAQDCQFAPWAYCDQVVLRAGFSAASCTAR
jgi:hypothetical protein